MRIMWQIEASEEAKKKIEDTINEVLEENKAISELIGSGEVKVIVLEKSARRQGKFVQVAIVKVARTMPGMSYTKALPKWGFKANPRGESITFHIPDPRE